VWNKRIHCGARMGSREWIGNAKFPKIESSLADFTIIELRIARYDVLGAVVTKTLRYEICGFGL
jgi:hypothetical protein